MKITITGSLYSGKSTLAKSLSEELNMKLYTVGEIQRHLAQERGMTIKEYNLYMDAMGLDEVIDKKTAEIGQKYDNFIFDARLAWNFIPDSFKIFLKVSEEEAVKRAILDHIRNAEEYKDEQEARRSILERINIENCRFKKLYNVDLYDMNNYDLIIDTSKLQLEEVYVLLKEEIEKVMKNSKG